MTWIFSVTLGLIVSSRPMPAPIAQNCGKQFSEERRRAFVEHDVFTGPKPFRHPNCKRVCRRGQDGLVDYQWLIRLCTWFRPRQPATTFSGTRSFMERHTSVALTQNQAAVLSAARPPHSSCQDHCGCNMDIDPEKRSCPCKEISYTPREQEFPIHPKIRGYTFGKLFQHGTFHHTPVKKWKLF